MAKKKVQPCTISLLAQKGGVGKTTLAISLAEWLVAKGIPVRLLDGNSGQQSLGRWAALRKQCDVSPAMEVAPTFEITVEHGATFLRDRTADLLRKGFDGVTLLDLPGGIEKELGPALRYSDLVLLPMPLMTFDFLSLTEIGALLRSADKVRRQDGLSSAKVFMVLNKRGRSAAQDRTKEQLLVEAGKLGFSLCRTELSYLSDFYSSTMMGRSPVSFAPSGKAAHQVDALAKELELGR